MKLYVLHWVAWGLGLLVHVEGRPLGYAPRRPADGGICGGLNIRDR